MRLAYWMTMILAAVAISGCTVNKHPEGAPGSVQSVAQKPRPLVGMATITAVTTPVNVLAHAPLLVATMPSMKITTTVADKTYREVCFPKANSATCSLSVTREIREGDRIKVKVDQRTCFFDCYEFEGEWIFDSKKPPAQAGQEGNFQTSVSVSFTPHPKQT
jgi:hypothetical protein